MKETEMRDHPLYKKAKRSYYFERWKWVGWNAFMTLALFIRLSRNYNTFDMILCMLCAVVSIFLLTVMPKTKFENSRECEEIKQMLR
jgi:hypothetical protein